MIMSKTSVIPNKTTTSLSINRELLKKAKEQGVNISLILDAALEKELNIFSQEEYLKAVERKSENLKKFLDKKGLNDEYYKFIEGGDINVLEKEKARNTSLGQALTSLKDSGSRDRKD